MLNPIESKKGWIRVVSFKGDSFILEIEIKGKGTQPVISDNGCKLEMCHSFRLNYSFRVARNQLRAVGRFHPQSQLIYEQRQASSLGQCTARSTRDHKGVPVCGMWIR